MKKKITLTYTPETYQLELNCPEYRNRLVDVIAMLVLGYIIDSDNQIQAVEALITKVKNGLKKYEQEIEDCEE
jgi:hypothetical protein